MHARAYTSVCNSAAIKNRKQTRIFPCSSADKQFRALAEVSREKRLDGCATCHRWLTVQKTDVQNGFGNAKLVTEMRGLFVENVTGFKNGHLATTLLKVITTRSWRQRARSITYNEWQLNNRQIP
jgi:hypothetical protein